MKKVYLQWIFIITVCGLFVLYRYSIFEDNPYLWDAKSRTIRWKPLVESIKISRARGVVFLAGSKSSLHISGSTDESGFAESELFPINESESYSLIVAMKIDADLPESSIPSIVCQFLGSGTNVPLGERTLTKSNKFHESEQLGKWLIQSARIQAPQGTEQFKLVVVPNSDSLQESSASKTIDIYINFIDISAQKQPTSNSTEQHNM